MSQPDKLKLIAAKAFSLPTGPNRRPPVAEDDTASEDTGYNESENTIFNELIHGVAGASARTIPSAEAPPPRASAVPEPVFDLLNIDAAVAPPPATQASQEESNVAPKATPPPYL